jgi:serine/threonine protein kinase
VADTYPDDPLLGRVIAGRFPVVDVIGRGGMGTVYQAIQEPIGRLVALKVLNAGSDSDMRSRFEREAQVVSRLQHPAHVPVIDYGIEGDGLLYLVLELVHGRPLRQVLKELGPMSPRRVVDIAVQLLGVLAEAHAQGLVHRDIKPSNIMLSRGPLGEDQAHLLDFGFAKILYGERQAAFGDQGGGSVRTRRGLVLGTPLYMSPEQATGRNVGPASDLYSLGVVIYKMLSGRTPFSEKDPVSILAAHRRQPPPPLPASTGAPPLLRDVIDRALAKRPEHRFQTAVEMAEALRNAVSRHLAWGASSTESMPPVPVEDVGLEADLPDADPSESEAEPLGPDSVVDESESPISLVLDIIDEPDSDDQSGGLALVDGVRAEDLSDLSSRTGPMIIALADLQGTVRRRTSGPPASIVPLERFRATSSDEDGVSVVVPIESTDDGLAPPPRRPPEAVDSDDRLFALTLQDLVAEEDVPIALDEGDNDVITAADAPAPVAPPGSVVPPPPPPPAPPPPTVWPTTDPTRGMPPIEGSQPKPRTTGSSSGMARTLAAAAMVAFVLGTAWVASHPPRTQRAAQTVADTPPSLTAAAPVTQPAVATAPPVVRPAPPQPASVAQAEAPAVAPEVEAIPTPPEHPAPVLTDGGHRAAPTVARPAPVERARPTPRARPRPPVPDPRPATLPMPEF